jgi:hypothetical protein
MSAARFARAAVHGTAVRLLAAAAVLASAAALPCRAQDATATAPPPPASTGVAPAAAATKASPSDDGAAAQFPDQPTTPDISLLTFGPGTVYWERFGHNAILVRDSGRSIAYNYGVFDFNQKNFFFNFLRGYMSYRMSADPLYDDLGVYQYEGRWVVAQHLDLRPEQARALRDFLQWNAEPENTRYRYDYFTSNCSTRVRDALDRALGGVLHKQLEDRFTTTTYRSEAVRLISPDLWLALAMDAALGPRADRTLSEWQQGFVPMRLMEAVRHVEITDAAGNRHPLVDRETQLLRGRLPPAPAAAPDLRPPFAMIGLGLAAAFLLLAWWRRARYARIAFSFLACSFSLVCGVGGVLLLLIWTCTQHWAGWRNENLLLFDPLCLLMLPTWFLFGYREAEPGPRGRIVAAAIAVIALFVLVAKLIPGFEQANQAWIFLLLPPQLVLALIAGHRSAADR